MARSWIPPWLSGAGTCRRSLFSVRSFGTSGGDDELRSLRRSLNRQEILVGMVVAVVDVTVFLVSGIATVAPVSALTMATLLAAADLALGAAPGTTAVVAVAQVITRVAACLLLAHYGLSAGLGDIGILVAGYRAGAWLSARAAMVIVPMLLAGVTAAAAIDGAANGDWRILVLIAVSNSVVPWLVGRYTAAGGAYITELEQRDRLRAQQQLAATELALADEREAIARDLHDVISHHVSAIGIHAGVARMSVTSNPDAAARSLSAVETSARAAMVDLRRQLDLLHGQTDAANRQPGLANLDELVESVAGAGLVVHLDLTGGEPTLPPSLDVTVFRIVQELLTNALRHGDGTATLRVCRSAGRIVVEQSNSIAEHPYSGDSTHRGIEGMRRRAELFGGTVSATTTDGRWNVVVSIPIGT